MSLSNSLLYTLSVAGAGRTFGFYLLSREPKLNSGSLIKLIEGTGLLTSFFIFFYVFLGEDSVANRGIGGFYAKF